MARLEAEADEAAARGGGEILWGCTVGERRKGGSAEAQAGETIRRAWKQVESCGQMGAHGKMHGPQAKTRKTFQTPRGKRQSESWRASTGQKTGRGGSHMAERERRDGEGRHDEQRDHKDWQGHSGEEAPS